MKTTTSATVGQYFDRLNKKKDWEECIASDLEFVGMKTRTSGKAAYVEATNQFLHLVKNVQIDRMIVDGGQVCMQIKLERKIEAPVAAVFAAVPPGPATKAIARPAKETHGVLNRSIFPRQRLLPYCTYCDSPTATIRYIF